MRITTRSAATLLAAGGAAVALIAAPVAAAAVPVGTSAACSTATPGTECVTAGNAQLNDSLPPDFTPQDPDFSLFGFGGHGGGAHR